MAKKAADAFRTISEVSEALDTPAHVLRFWESKFKQIKPVKRAGGRRYYRPEDIDLLSGIKSVLHDQGMTIKGAQKLLREKGVKYVSDLAPLSNTPEVAAPKKSKAVKDVIDAKPVAVKIADTKEDTNDPVKLTGTAIPESDLPSLDVKEANGKPGLLSAITKQSTVALSKKADAIAPIYEKLSALHERMRPA